MINHGGSTFFPLNINCFTDVLQIWSGKNGKRSFLTFVTINCQFNQVIKAQTIEEIIVQSSKLQVDGN